MMDTTVNKLSQADKLTTLFRSVKATSSSAVPPRAYRFRDIIEVMTSTGELVMSRRDGSTELINVRAGVEAVRGAASGSDRDAKKALLPAICVNGFAVDVNGVAKQLTNDDFFRGGKTFNGIIQIDIDNHFDTDDIARDKAEALLRRFKTASDARALREMTLFCARSSTGRGVFLFIQAPERDKKTLEGFKAAFHRAANLVSAVLDIPLGGRENTSQGLEIDPSTKDAARKRFLTWDPEAFVNLEAVPLYSADEDEDDEEDESAPESSIHQSTLWDFIESIGGTDPAGVESGVIDTLVSLCADCSFVPREEDLKKGVRGHGTRSNSVFIGEMGSGKSSQISAIRDILADLSLNLPGDSFDLVCAQTTAAMREVVRLAGCDPVKDDAGKVIKENGRPLMTPRSPSQAPRKRLLFVRDEAGETGTAKAKSQFSTDLPAFERAVFASATTLPRTRDTQSGVDTVPVHANIVAFSTMEQWAAYRAFENDANGEGRRRLYFRLPARPKEYTLLATANNNIETHRYEVKDLLTKLQFGVPHGTRFVPRSVDNSSYAYVCALALREQGWRDEEIDTLFFNTACKNAAARLALGKIDAFENDLPEGAYYLENEDYDYALDVMTASKRVRDSITRAEELAKSEALKSYKDKARDQLEAMLKRSSRVALSSIKRRGENFEKALADGIEAGEYLIESDSTAKRKYVRRATAEEKEAIEMKTSIEARASVRRKASCHVAKHSYQSSQAVGDITGMESAVARYVEAAREDLPSDARGSRHTNLMTLGARLVKAGMWGDVAKGVLSQEYSTLPVAELEKALRWLDNRPDAA